MLVYSDEEIRNVTKFDLTYIDVRDYKIIIMCANRLFLVHVVFFPNLWNGH